MSTFLAIALPPGLLDQARAGERVQLLNSLVGMRYAEAVRVDVQAATHEGAI